MVLKLYYYDGSAPSRASLLTIHALGLENEIKIKTLDLMKREQLTADYLKLNPLHTVPTLVDDDFVVYDSHAINTYLVDKFGKDDSLYPKDLQKRAIVDQLLHYDNGTAFIKWTEAFVPLLRGATAVSEEAKKGIHDLYSYLNTILETRKFTAGNELTLADLHLGTTVNNIILAVPLDSSQYPKVDQWISTVTSLPYYEKVNQVGLGIIGGILKMKLKS